jgi:hypothetical protein
MGFNMTDLLLEGVINEGFEAIKKSPKLIDDVFSKLSNISPIINKKFGKKEIARIKKYFVEKEIKVVQAFPNQADVPSISIQLIDGAENQRYAHIDDFVGESTEDITDIEELAEKVRAQNLGVSDYDPLSGTLTLDSNDNITNVVKNNLFVDASGDTFPILAIVDELGDKRLLIEKGSNPDISDVCSVKSQITWKQHEVRGNIEDEKLLIGIHTEERLLTIYLFTLVKYFILSRKKDLIKRGFHLSSYNVSDFNRNQNFQADHVYSRYITLSGIVENEWESDVIDAIEAADITINVDQDEFGNEALNLEDQTVKVTDE